MRWLTVAVCATLAGLGLAEIECFTNGISAYLFDHFGQGGLIKCKSATECFESVSESPSSTDATIKYSSGCTACVKWPFNSECKTCKTPLCNIQIAKRITDNNLLCYFADDEAKMGEKRVWCSKDAGTCYHLEYKNKYNEQRYHAGCGKGWSGVKTCKTSLCNIPDSMSASAQPPSNIDFVALSQGQPAKRPSKVQAVAKNETAEAILAAEFNKKLDDARKANESKKTAKSGYEYDYDGSNRGGATAALVAAFAGLVLLTTRLCSAAL